MTDRRTFLRGLVSLPLIGGSVALIGNPTAAAVPITPKLLDAYEEWLDLERSYLTWERFGRDGPEKRYGANVEVVWRDRTTGKAWTMTVDNDFSGFDHRHAASRAAVILSAAGVPLPGGSRG